MEDSDPGGDERAVGDGVLRYGEDLLAAAQAVSVTQATELGTCYTPRELCARSHDLGLAVHLDGARLANAAAGLGVPLAACTTEAGVDVVSFGGTKNGLLFGECVAVLDPARVPRIGYLRKSSAQLASKMRFLSVQFEALLAGDLWHRNAAHANAMARRLADRLRDTCGVSPARPVQSNAVLVRLPPEVIAALRRTQPFHMSDPGTGEVRWMCSFDTTERDVDAFAAAVLREPGRPR